MADEELLVSRVVSRGSGVPGRALNQARTNHWVIDSSHEPEAVSTVESFLAGISACGVTLVDNLARSEGTPLTGIEVTIEGARAAQNTSAFKSIDLRFRLSGVNQARAEELVGVYKER